MALYETVFIGRQDLSEAQVTTITETITNYVTAQKGKVLKTENWGLRTLAYRINKNKKGHYVLVEFDADTSIIAEMERQLRLNEDVLRYMTVRLETASTEASAVLRSSSDDTTTNARGRDTGYRGARKPLTQEAA